MIGRGRPLRFLGLVSLGWVSARIAFLWPQTGSLPAAIEQLMPLGAATAAAGRPPAPAPVARPALRASIARTIAARNGIGAAKTGPLADPVRVQLALLALVRYGAPIAWAGPSPAANVALLPSTAIPDRLDPLPQRWSASAWFAARPGTGIGAAPGGSQIGGSQAGVRIAWLLAPKARVALFGRVVSPLAGKGREAAVGVEWQPMRAPVRLVVEQRFGLDGTQGGPGVGVIAGYDAAAAPGFRLESYGQAGVIDRARAEPYADGAARITREIVESSGVRLSIGAGIWGAAQRDAARFDVGPSATLALRIAGQNFRLALDWRQRIAGDARPGSGPAFTIGADF